jgi:four helix bundle protein
MATRRFEDIKAWQIAREVTRETYRISMIGAFARDFALRDQLTRAAGSMMHNIAEGFDAGSNAEFARFLGYAKRSCTEVQSEVYAALDQAYIDQNGFERLYQMAGECRAAIKGFIAYLNGCAPRTGSVAPNFRTPNSDPDPLDDSRLGTRNSAPGSVADSELGTRNSEA